MTLLNGLTLASLYFLVASGFTLVFGLMRNVNLAHGSLYLLGAYVGLIVAESTGSWLLAVAAGFLAAAVLGLLMQVLIFRFMQGAGPAPDAGDDRPVDRLRRPDAVGLRRPDCTIDPPAWIYGSTVLPLVAKFPTYRIGVLRSDRHRRRPVAASRQDADRHDDPRRRRRPRHARRVGRQRAARVRDHVRDRRRPGRPGRRRRRHGELSISPGEDTRSCSPRSSSSSSAAWAASSAPRSARC